MMRADRIADKFGVSQKTVSVWFSDENIPRYNVAESPSQVTQEEAGDRAKPDARRNLTPESIAYLRGKLYREERKAEGRPGKLAQTEQVSGDTASRLAEQFSTAPATIRRDTKFSEQLDALAEGNR